MDPDIDKQKYAKAIKYRLKEGGVYIVTSCNCTSHELDEIFTKDGIFKKKIEIRGYPQFTFGNVTGQDVTMNVYE